MTTTLFYYDHLVFEERVQDNRIQITITVSDKQAESSRAVFDKSVSLPLFACIAMTFLPLVCLGVLIGSAWAGLAFLLKKPRKEVSYEEAKEYFRSGKGYLQNLSDEQKKQLLTRRKESTLGL